MALERLNQVKNALLGSVQPSHNNEIVPSALNPFRCRVPPTLAVNETPLTPISFLLRAAQIYPDSTCLQHPERGYSFTYSQWAMRIANLAHGLAARGVKRGDRVAVICPNVPMILDASQAVPAMGAIVVQVNIRLTKAEIAYILEHSGAVMVLVDSQFAHTVSDAKIPVVIADDTRPAGDAYEALIAEGYKASNGTGFSTIDGIADENMGLALNYTSGTTGRPKGCLTTHRGVYLAALANASECNIRHESVYLWILPAFHASGWTYPYAIPAAMASQVCMRQVGDYTQPWKYFKELGVTTYCAAPTVQIGIVQCPAAERLPQQVIACCAGSAPTAHTIGQLDKLNISITHTYGLTETYGPFTRSYEKDDWPGLEQSEVFRRKARQGQSFLTADEAIVVKTEPDSQGRLVEVQRDGKELGEIVVRGNIVMKEYYNDPEATAKAFAGGYYHSGDLAVIYPDGTISIQDRSKDLIISGGENASSIAIESEVISHPDVSEVAVIARHHDKFGERAMAYVLLSAAGAKKWVDREVELFKELHEHVKPRLPGFARPEWYEVVSELPKTSTGKLQKNVLRQRLKEHEKAKFQ